MKIVEYPMTDGSTKVVEYDENAPCKICGLPVISASMGGTDVCPWCDCGVYRDGRKWHSIRKDIIRKEAERVYENLLIQIDIKTNPKS